MLLEFQSLNLAVKFGGNVAQQQMQKAARKILQIWPLNLAEMLVEFWPLLLAKTSVEMAAIQFGRNFGR